MVRLIALLIISLLNTGTVIGQYAYEYLKPLSCGNFGCTFQGFKITDVNREMLVIKISVYERDGSIFDPDKGDTELMKILEMKKSSHLTGFDQIDASPTFQNAFRNNQYFKTNEDPLVVSIKDVSEIDGCLFKDFIKEKNLDPVKLSNFFNKITKLPNGECRVKTLMVVMEELKECDLFQKPEQEMVTGVMKFMKKVHDGGYIHGDFKRNNIMCDKNKNMKMIDVDTIMMFHKKKHTLSFLKSNSESEVIESCKTTACSGYQIRIYSDCCYRSFSDGVLYDIIMFFMDIKYAKTGKATFKKEDMIFSHCKMINKYVDQIKYTDHINIGLKLMQSECGIKLGIN